MSLDLFWILILILTSSQFSTLEIFGDSTEVFDSGDISIISGEFQKRAFIPNAVHDTFLIDGAQAFLGNINGGERVCLECEDSIGEVLVFRNDSGSWQLQQRITRTLSPVKDQEFGWNLSKHGDKLLISTHHNSFYLYEEMNKNWQLSQVFQDNVGWVPTLDFGGGGGVIVAYARALVRQPSGIQDWQYLQLYNQTSGNWEINQYLYNNAQRTLWNGVAYGDDEIAVHENGNWIFAGTEGQGVVVFHKQGDQWTIAQRITAPETDGFDSDGFGRSFDVDGDDLVISRDAFERDGAVYCYSLIGSSWEFQEVIKPIESPVTSGGGNFGRDVSIKNGRMIIGRPWTRIQNFSLQVENEGAVYLYDKRADGRWNLIQCLNADEVQSQVNSKLRVSAFGLQVDIDSKQVLVGARQTDSERLNSGQPGYRVVGYILELEGDHSENSVSSSVVQKVDRLSSEDFTVRFTETVTLTAVERADNLAGPWQSVVLPSTPLSGINEYSFPIDQNGSAQFYRIVTTNDSPSDGQEPSATIPDPVLEMVPIPAGTFLMGSPSGDQDARIEEFPQTEVTISFPFWMSRTEVTRQQYEAVMGTNPSSLTQTNPNNPVVGVDWFAAVEFCRRLTERERVSGKLLEGHEYHLPTEAQWEYACRAGSSSRFSYGDDLATQDLDQYAWCGENWFGGHPHPVAQKLPNPWGLYDMHGNVAEWCLDYYSDYQGGELVDPVGIVPSDMRIFRSGSWNYPGRECRSANRFALKPSQSIFFVGFRPALVPDSGNLIEIETNVPDGGDFVVP